MIRQATHNDLPYILNIIKNCTNHMINNKIYQWNKNYPSKGIFKNDIVTTIEDDSVFYLAENYHHDYFNLNSNVPYCSFVIAPKVKKLMDSKSSLIIKD